MDKNTKAERYRFAVALLFIVLLLVSFYLASLFRTYHHEINIATAERRTESQIFGITYKTEQWPTALTFFTTADDFGYWIHFSTQDELSTRGYSMGMHFVLDLQMFGPVIVRSNADHEAKKRIAQAILEPLADLKDLNDYGLQEDIFLIVEQRLTCIVENLNWDDEAESFDLSMEEVERVLAICEFTPDP